MYLPDEQACIAVLICISLIMSNVAFLHVSEPFVFLFHALFFHVPGPVSYWAVHCFLNNSRISLFIEEFNNL